MEAAVPVVSGLGAALGRETPATGHLSAGNPSPLSREHLAPPSQEAYSVVTLGGSPLWLTLA